MRLALTAVVLLLVFKAAVVLLSLGSGTSGGTLAPMFMISAAIGSTFAMVVNYLVPERASVRGRVRGGGHGRAVCAPARARHLRSWFARSKLRTISMRCVPVMLVCVIADAIAVRYMPNSIMTEKLARMGFGTGSGLRNATRSSSSRSTTSWPATSPRSCRKKASAKSPTALQTAI